MLSPDSIEDSIAQFKLDLRNYTSLDMARRHIIFGECATISSEEYFALRSHVATAYSVHPNEVIIVGHFRAAHKPAPASQMQFDVAPELE